MEETRQNIKILAEMTHKQAKNIDNLVEVVGELSDQVDNRPTRKTVWKIVGIVAAAVIALMLALSALAYVSSTDTLDEVRSCTVPEGECAERNAKASAQAIGQIVCNQEKVLYFTYYDEGYVPFDYCTLFVNEEIDRLDPSLIVHPPKLDVPNVEQFDPTP